MTEIILLMRRYTDEDDIDIDPMEAENIKADIAYDEWVDRQLTAKAEAEDKARQEREAAEPPTWLLVAALTWLAIMEVGLSIYLYGGIGR